jgi:integrase/recombinase XerD
MHFFDIFVDCFLEMLSCQKGLAKNTLVSYRQDLEDWGCFLRNRKQDWQCVQKNDVQAYIDFLYQRGLSSRSISRKLSAMRQFYDFDRQEHQKNSSPMDGIHLPKYTSALPQELSPEEIQALLQESAKDIRPEGRRLNAILEMLYATGMRISELVTLPYDVLYPLLESNQTCVLMAPLESSLSEEKEEETGACALYIQGKGGHERYVFLTPECVSALNAYLTIRPVFSSAPDNPYVFASGKSHLTRQRVGQLLKELALKAQVNPLKVTPHGVRHAFATHLLRAGVDLVMLKTLLGHQDIATTQIYTQIERSRFAEILSKHHPLSGYGS